MQTSKRINNTKENIHFSSVQMKFHILHGYPLWCKNTWYWFALYIDFVLVSISVVKSLNSVENCDLRRPEAALYRGSFCFYKSEMSFWITLSLLCSSWIFKAHRWGRGKRVRTDILLLLLSESESWDILSEVCGALYLHTNQINTLDHTRHLHQHLFKLFIKFYSREGKSPRSPWLIGTTALDPVYYS